MHAELRYGKIKYISFLILDLLCLLLANLVSFYIYLGGRNISYRLIDHFSVVIVMVIVDIIVTFSFSTLRRVLRWRKEREVYESARHIFFCFIILALYLFLTKSGAGYSRAIVLIAYGINYVLILAGRTSWRYVLSRIRKRSDKPSVLLMTTDCFADEGVERLEELNYDVQYIFLLKNIATDDINGIPVVKDVKEIASILCWKSIDKVYIYGLNHQMVPEYLKCACKEMGLSLDLVDFNYRVIEIKTIQSENPKYGSLSFLEGKRDIPFPIRRAYWITETEADLHRGFHAHKLNCQLLYCPYGVIDIILDDGENRTTVTLDRPSKGLILMPGLWREMVWKQNGSVLCVLASEYYDAQEYIRNYDDFISYSKDYKDGSIKKGIGNDENSVCQFSPYGAGIRS